MAEQARVLDEGMLALEDVEVGTAHADMAYVDGDKAVAGRRHRPLLDRKSARLDAYYRSHPHSRLDRAVMALARAISSVIQCLKPRTG
jgi:hypothetical protein